jgi:hypothetical protein
MATTTKQPSKAQLKRDEEKRNQVYRTMSKQLVEFKNKYIADYVQYEINQIKGMANTFRGMTEEAVEKNFVGQHIDSVRSMLDNYEFSLVSYRNRVDRWNKQEDLGIIYGVNLRQRKQAQRTLELIEISKVQFYTDALVSYKAKFNKLVDKMCATDVQWNSNIQVERIGAGYDNFEILLYNPTEYVRDYESGTDSDGNFFMNNFTEEELLQKRREKSELFFHARMIYACGDVVRPHFRFITTTRKNY